MFLSILQGFVILATLIESRQGSDLAETAVLEARQGAETHDCPSKTVTVTTAGVSLMQAASVSGRSWLSTRVTADQLSDEDLTDDSMFDNMVAADRRAHGQGGVGMGAGKTHTMTSHATPRAGAGEATAAAKVRELNHAGLAGSASGIASRQPPEENPLYFGGRVPDPPMSFVSELAQKGHLAAKSAALAASTLLKGNAFELDITARTFLAGMLILIIALVLYIITMHPEGLVHCCFGSSYSRGPLGETDQIDEEHGSSGGVDANDEAEVTFCPDLIVPRDRECVLFVPELSEAAKSDEVVFKDANGEAVLRAAAATSSQKSFMSFNSQSSSSSVWKVSLATASGTTLAQCCEAPGGGKEYQLLGPKGELFGTLSKNDERDAYILNTSCGRHFRFWGNFDEQAINVTSDKGRLLATSEVSEPDFDKTGNFIRLRIFPLVDAGIVLCSMLCISHHLG